MYFYGAVPSERTVGSNISKQLKVSQFAFFKVNVLFKQIIWFKI